MRLQPILFLTIVTILLATTSCKKDDEVMDEDNICTEARPIWLDGTTGDFEFVTSEPCNNLRLADITVTQTHQNFGGHFFTFSSIQSIQDSLGGVKGTMRVSIGAMVPGAQVDTTINNNDTLYTVNTTNICNNMKLGKHYGFVSEANQNNANAFALEYTDTLGRVWQGFMPTTDSSFVVTAVDGIISQNPFQGAYLPYCVVRVDYDVMLLNATADTLHLQGTGRLGFR